MKPAKQTRIENGLAVLLALSAFSVYCVTLAPSLYWGDSAELQRAAKTLEVPHPSGYPLYVLLSHLWTLALPFGGTAWKVNLFSAFAAAVSVGVVFRIILALTGRVSAALLASLMLGTSAAYWSQAVIAEVYALHLLLVSLLMLSLADSGTRWNRRWFTVPLLIGLDLFHHRMAILLGPGLLFLLVCAWRRNELRPTKGNIVELCLAGLLSLTPVSLMYLGHDWPSFLTFVTFFLRGSNFFSLHGVPEYLRTEVIPLLLQQLGIPGLAIMACGVSRISRFPDSRSEYGRFLGLNWCAGVAFLVVLRVPDLFAFVPHVQLMGALLFGLGVARILSGVGRRVPADWSRSVVAGLCFVLVGCFVVQGLRSYRANDLSGDLTAEIRTREMLEDVEANAILLAGWAVGQPLLTQQTLNGLRPDVTIGFGNEHTRADLAPYLRTGRPVYLWGIWWRDIARRYRRSFEAVRPEVHATRLYPGGSASSFDREFRLLLEKNRYLYRYRGSQSRSRSEPGSKSTSACSS